MKIKRLLATGMCLSVMFTGVAQEKPATKNIATYFKSEKKYLVLPVKNGAPKKNLELWVDGVLTRYWNMELAEGIPEWNTYIDISEWKGKSVELRVDKVAKDSKVFSTIEQTDVDETPLTYHEKLRGQFHFSPKRGWNNDPNGMVYFNGEYHLFYQHNPYGRGWGNMTWGHAVSKDLVHWKELGDAIHPHQGGTVFSGSAVVDDKNSSGLSKDGKPIMVAFHTGDKGWGQYMSWSVDGRNFNNYAKAVVPRIIADNRDPKVIWHEPSKKWIMVLWVPRGENRQNSMQILSSSDLKNWKEESVVYGGVGDDRFLYECPEFYELPVEGLSGVKKWVLVGANTEYAIGTFDGKTFSMEGTKLQNQYGRDFYAPQTFNNEPKGRRVEIGWWRTHTDKGDMTFNQSMSIPLEHKLVQTPDGIRLTRMPVQELEILRNKTYYIGKATLKENGTNPLKDINIELAEIRLDIEPEKSKEVTLNVRGVAVTYNVADQQLIVDGVKAPVALLNGKLSLIVYADRIGLEIFANNGLVFMPINININEENRSLSLSGIGGNAKVSNLVVYELNSIWK